MDLLLCARGLSVRLISPQSLDSTKRRASEGATSLTVLGSFGSGSGSSSWACTCRKKGRAGGHMNRRVKRMGRWKTGGRQVVRQVGE